MSGIAQDFNLDIERVTAAIKFEEHRAPAARAAWVVPPTGWFINADVLGLYHVLHAARRSSVCRVQFVTHPSGGSRDG